MSPTADSFRALARSSPWRWRSAHLTRRDPEGTVEAWVERPGRLRVLVEGREHLVVEEPRQRSVLVAFSGPDLPERYPEVGAGVLDLPDPVPPQVVEPVLRPDGLVAERPDEFYVEYDDPMWQDYTWVAMLDPVELSHHVDVADLRADVVADRPVWRARLRAEEGYQARCGCCELLWSEVSDRDEVDAGGTSWFELHPDAVFPDAYDVALDVGTGIVVHLAPVGGSRTDLGFDVTIHGAS